MRQIPAEPAIGKHTSWYEHCVEFDVTVATHLPYSVSVMHQNSTEPTVEDVHLADDSLADN